MFVASVADEYMTFTEYKEIEKNKNRNFDDYIDAYFREKAMPHIKCAFGQSIEQVGHFSRITNELPSIHQHYTHSDIVRLFLTAMEHLEEVEDNYKDDVVKRWVYALIKPTAFIFLQPDGKIKEKFLKIIAEELGISIQNVSDTLYGSPLNSDRVEAIANQIVGAASVAVSQIISSDPETLHHPRVIPSPDEEERILTINCVCNNLSSLQQLMNFFKTDFFLSRSEQMKLQVEFLKDIDSLLPEHEKLESLEVLNSLLEKLAWDNSIADTAAYRYSYYTFYAFLEDTGNTLAKKSPELKDIFNQYKKLNDDCYAKLTGPSEEVRKPALLELELALTELKLTAQELLPAYGPRP